VVITVLKKYVAGKPSVFAFSKVAATEENRGFLHSFTFCAVRYAALANSVNELSRKRIDNIRCEGSVLRAFYEQTQSPLALTQCALGVPEVRRVRDRPTS
jgi:hypothetical protein